MDEENMAQYRSVYRCDFNEITGKEPVFVGGFDLAISFTVGKRRGKALVF